MRKMLNGHELIDRAESLGVWIYREDENIPIGQKPLMAAIVSEYEIQRRVTEAERHIREHRLWIVAMVSAVASVLSALVSVFAVMGHK